MPGEFISDIAAFAQANPAIGAVLVGGLVGGAHFLAHNGFGQEWAFEEAGVRQAGIAVMLVATTVAFLLLWGGA